MKSIKSKGTKVEVLFGKELWSEGFRYRKQYKIVGRPDFVFVSRKVAIFVDGDFWHGNGWKKRGFGCLEDSIKVNKKYWIPKIQQNIARDKKVNRELRKEGWTVIRVWESDIKKNLGRDVQKVLLKIGNKI